MAWTYDPAQLADSRMMRVRLLVGDTLSDDPQLQDEEISSLLTLRSQSVYGAAAESCRSLASQMARQADSVQGELHTLYSSRSRAYAAMAARYETLAIARSTGLPYAGGISVGDKQNQLADENRVQPQFNLGMEDNFLPVGEDRNELLEPSP